jgi:hypothetical protein
MRNRPTIVAVIADTHIRHLSELPLGLMSTLASVDAVIHLGDYDSRELLDELRKLGNFYGVAGNHDDKLLRQELKGMEVLEVDGKRLGLIHGFSFPLAIQERMKALFKKHNIDAILYGHTHFATSRTIDGVFLFNPGSVTGHFPASCCSFGLLTLDGSISGEIVPLENTRNGGRGFLIQLAAMLLQKAMRWVETWPYPDFPQYTANTRLALKRSFLGLGKPLF